MHKKVLETIRKYDLIKSGGKVVAAVSGGPDSACLLHILHSLRNELDITIFAIHINHMLRGSESDEDQAYTAELCRSMGISLYAAAFDVREYAEKSGMSLEEAGREIRYREFESYADSVGASSIAVAHNRNDQAETVLMHIIRGSGISGLTGMEYRRGRIIRPLLDITRKEIEEYCTEYELNPRTDSSNLKSEFTRNRLRLELIPLINENFGTDFTESLCRLSVLAACDNNLLDSLAEEKYAACLAGAGEGYVNFRLAGLRELHPALLGRVLRIGLSRMAGSLKGIGMLHLERLADLASKGLTGPVVQLPGGIRAAVSYDIFKIFMEKEAEAAEDFEINISIPGRTDLPGGIAYIEASLEEAGEHIDKYKNLKYNSLVQFFDYGCFKQGINIRNRREGDIFKPYGSNGTKKLKEYFIDSRIPREDRGKMPLVASGRDIVWVMGRKISDKFKVTENTKNVLKLEVFL